MFGWLSRKGRRKEGNNCPKTTAIGEQREGTPGAIISPLSASSNGSVVDVFNIDIESEFWKEAISMEVTIYKSINNIKLHIISILQKDFDYKIPLESIIIYCGNFRLASNALLMDYQIDSPITLSCIKADKLINIRVWFMHDGYRLSIINISNYITILQIKQLVCNSKQIPVWNQEIVCNGRILQNNQILADCGIRSDSYLYLACMNLNIPRNRLYLASPPNTESIDGYNSHTSNYINYATKPYIVPMTCEDIKNLHQKQFIYHRCKVQKFQFMDAMIKQVRGNKVMVHYIKLPPKYDVVSDISTQRHHFGKHVILNNRFAPTPSDHSFDEFDDINSSKNVKTDITMKSNNDLNIKRSNKFDLLTTSEAIEELNDLYLLCLNNICNFYGSYCTSNCPEILPTIIATEILSFIELDQIYIQMGSKTNSLQKNGMILNNKYSQEDNIGKWETVICSGELCLNKMQNVYSVELIPLEQEMIDINNNYEFEIGIIGISRNSSQVFNKFEKIKGCNIKNIKSQTIISPNLIEFGNCYGLHCNSSYDENEEMSGKIFINNKGLDGSPRHNVTINPSKRIIIFFNKSNEDDEYKLSFAQFGPKTERDGLRLNVDKKKNKMGETGKEEMNGMFENMVSLVECSVRVDTSQCEYFLGLSSNSNNKQFEFLLKRFK